jgi:hypothetical protein
MRAPGFIWANALGTGGLRTHIGVVTDDGHLEGFGALYHFAPNAAHTDYAEGFAAQFVSQEFLLFPLAGFGGNTCLRHRSRHGEH